MKLSKFKREIDALGYKFESFPMEKSRTTQGNQGYVMPCLVEKDTGISFAHYKDARRDENFKRLQELRFNSEVFYRGIECWI